MLDKRTLHWPEVCMPVYICRLFSCKYRDTEEEKSVSDIYQMNQAQRRIKTK